jgi:hypothetical protein
MTRTEANKEKEKRIQTAVEAWGWKVQEGALQEAARREGAPALSSLEIQLKRLSEQVTRQAQKKYKQIVETQKSSWRVKCPPYFLISISSACSFLIGMCCRCGGTMRSGSFVSSRIRSVIFPIPQR